MAKKTLKPDWAKITFWALMIIAVIAILTSAIIFIVNSIRDIGNTISGETTTAPTPVETQVAFPEFAGDPGNVVGAVDIIHVSMDEIDWTIHPEGELVATVPVEYQLGNDRIRFGNNVFMEKSEPGTYPELRLLTTTSRQYEYIDENGFARSLSYSGMYSVHGQNMYLVAGSGEDIGKRFMVVTDIGMITVLVVDENEYDEDGIIVSSTLIYEIYDGYVPEEYPETDGNGNLI